MPMNVPINEGVATTTSTLFMRARHSFEVFPLMHRVPPLQSVANVSYSEYEKGEVERSKTMSYPNSHVECYIEKLGHTRAWSNPEVSRSETDGYTA